MNQSTLLTRIPSKNAKMKRKMSVKGAIKKTRSFMLDGNNISKLSFHLFLFLSLKYYCV